MSGANPARTSDDPALHGRRPEAPTHKFDDGDAEPSVGRGVSFYPLMPVGLRCRAVDEAVIVSSDAYEKGKGGEPAGDSNEARTSALPERE